MTALTSLIEADALSAFGTVCVVMCGENLVSVISLEVVDLVV